MLSKIYKGILNLWLSNYLSEQILVDEQMGLEGSDHVLTPWLFTLTSIIGTSNLK